MVVLQSKRLKPDMVYRAVFHDHNAQEIKWYVSMERDLPLIQMTDYISCKDLSRKNYKAEKSLTPIRNTYKITTGNHTHTHTHVHTHMHTQIISNKLKFSYWTVIFKYNKVSRFLKFAVQEHLLHQLVLQRIQSNELCKGRLLPVHTSLRFWAHGLCFVNQLTY